MKKELLEAPKVKVHKPTKVTMTPLELKMKKEIARLEKIDKEKAEKAKKIFQEIIKLRTQIYYISKERSAKIKNKENQLDILDNRLSPKLEIAIKYIKKNCSDILRILKKQNRFLFRGVDFNLSDSPFVANSPINRRPLDSSKESQIQIDNILKKEGFKALRSNSIFVTSDYNQAGYFGEIIYVFPINGFSYTWNFKYSDFVNNKGLTKMDEYFDNHWEKYSDKITTFLDKINDKIYQLYDNGKKIPKELLEIEKISEDVLMMRFIDDYLAVKTEFLPRCKKRGAMLLYNYVDNLIKTLESKINTSAKAWGFTNTDIEKAIKKGHEICIHGKYVAIPERLLSKYDSKYIRKVILGG